MKRSREEPERRAVDLVDAELGAIVAGGSRRHVEPDRAGAYNFIVEVEGVAAGFVRAGDPRKGTRAD